MIKAKIKMMLKNVGEKLVYMSDKLCNVKTVTVTGTTNGNGAFSLASVANYKNGDEVLSVATNTDANALCIPWVYSKDNWYVSVLHWQSWAQKANTSFTFTVRVKVGVLRNLSIFKAFRHFMSLQKGGGVDVQTEIKTAGRKDSDSLYLSRNRICRILVGVIFKSKQSKSHRFFNSAGWDVLYVFQGTYVQSVRTVLSDLLRRSRRLPLSDRISCTRARAIDICLPRQAGFSEDGICSDEFQHTDYIHLFRERVDKSGKNRIALSEGGCVA